jgi:hypothetical protein
MIANFRCVVFDEVEALVADGTVFRAVTRTSGTLCGATAVAQADLIILLVEGLFRAGRALERETSIAKCTSFISVYIAGLTWPSIGARASILTANNG